MDFSITGNQISPNAGIPTSALADGQAFLLAVGGVDAHYRHSQGVPSDTWVIIHNLNKRPAITVTDSAGTVVQGSIQYDSLAQATATFSAPFSGYAECN